ncbi:hypothetical protein A9Q78_00165 [Methylophaga sp. 41_12_T18]|nr:hypothetical protein A9Q78_00165 [Methylophaga sp. 41_12_T18]
MKKILLLILLAASPLLQAGGYSQHINQGYDTETGIYYHPVKHNKDAGGMFSSKSDRRIKNIFIFDPATNNSRYLFKRDSIYSIETFTLEMELNETGKVEFFGYRNRMLNNAKVPSRPLRDRLLIVTSKENSEQNTMWLANKNGSDLKELHRFHQNTRWHLDVKNKKIRFITGTNEISINSFDW